MLFRLSTKLAPYFNCSVHIIVNKCWWLRSIEFRVLPEMFMDQSYFPLLRCQGPRNMFLTFPDMFLFWLFDGYFICFFLQSVVVCYLICMVLLLRHCKYWNCFVTWPLTNSILIDNSFWHKTWHFICCNTTVSC